MIQRSTTKRVLIGTAWLSSARVVKFSINLHNERNPKHKFKIIIVFKEIKRPTASQQLKNIVFFYGIKSTSGLINKIFMIKFTACKHLHEPYFTYTKNNRLWGS